MNWKKIICPNCCFENDETAKKCKRCGGTLKKFSKVPKPKIIKIDHQFNRKINPR